MQFTLHCTRGALKSVPGRHPLCQKAVPVSPHQAPVRLSHLRRLRVASTSATTLLDRPLKHEHHKRLKVLPRVQYSYDHKEIDCEELLELFLRAGLDLSRHMPPGDAVIQDKSVGREQLLGRLEHSVAKSMTVIIASVLEDKLPSYQDPDAEANAASKDDWSWVKARRQRKKKKVLAGFVRATGDCALTASIHDLAVLPELQGLGLGRKLLAKATNQVRSKTGTTDIGLAANAASYGFFGKCGFDLDREKSTFMAFAAESMSTTATDKLKGNTALLQALAQATNT